MSKLEDYASDSDQSDEDFCPDKGNNSDAPSEEESDDPISENEEEYVSNKKSKTKKKSNKKQTKKSESPQAEPEAEHGVSTRNRVETSTKSSLEKDALDSDDDDTKRKDALWADFLSDIPTATPSNTNTNKAASTSRRETNPNPLEKERPRNIGEKTTSAPPNEPEKVKVTEIFEFAGEEVRVEKVVSADNLKENGVVPETARGSVKRSGGAGGLGSVLGQIGKKKKISVLEKTKLDWDSFKTTEGIDEELQTFNKGKEGYLQKQDFLERTDLRQFEIEKNMRQSRRKPL